MKRLIPLPIAAVALLALSACSDEPWQPGGKTATSGGSATPGAETGGTGSKPGDKPDPGGKPDTPQGDDGGNTVNLAPQLSSFRVESSVVEVRGATSLEIAVADPENDPFYIWWRASCGAVAQDADEPGKAIFIAPAEPGECQVTALVQDSEMQTAFEQVTRIQVVPAADSEADDV